MDKSSIPCMYGNKCRNGPSCPFSHAILPNQTPADRQIYCRHGNDCFTKDCAFYHPDGRQTSTSTRSSQNQSSTSYGSQYRGQQRTQYEAISDNISDTYSQGGLSQSSSGGKKPCKFNLGCTRTDCYFKHDTANGESPASQMNNGNYQVRPQPQTQMQYQPTPQRISQQQNFRGQQNQQYQGIPQTPMNQFGQGQYQPPINQFSQNSNIPQNPISNRQTVQQNQSQATKTLKPPQSEPDGNSEQFDYDYKEDLKLRFQIQKTLKDIQKAYKQVLLSFDLSVYDKLIFTLNMNHVHCEQVKNEITDNLLTKTYFTLENELVNIQVFREQFINTYKKELDGIKYDIACEDQYSSSSTTPTTGSDPQIVIYTPKNQQDQNSKIQQLLEEFNRDKYKAEYNIFLGCEYMQLAERFLKYNYLKTTKALECLVQEIGKVFLNYDDHSQAIKANLVFTQFEQIQDSIRALIDQIFIEEVDFQSYLVVHQTKLHNDKTLAQKAEEKFKVKITEEVEIQQNQSLITRGGQNTTHKAVFKRLMPPPKVFEMRSYRVVVTGEETDQAIQYLNEQVPQYQLFTEKLPRLTKQSLQTFYQEHLKIAKSHSTVTLYDQANFSVQILGKNRNYRLTQTWEEIEEIWLSNQRRMSVTIDLSDAPNKILFHLLHNKQDQILKIQKQYTIEIKVDKYKLTIDGADEKIREADPSIKQLLKETIADIQTRVIVDNNMFKAVDQIRKKENIDLEKEFNVIIKKENQQVAQNTVRAQTTNISFIGNQQKAQVTDARWSYKVYTTDQNYAQRIDKINDWFDFDEDQNWQIEQHFKHCCDMKNFGKRQKITGDQNQVKNGFDYEVYGPDSNPSNWVEENLKTKRTRALKRRQLQKEEVKGFEMSTDDSKQRAFISNSNDFTEHTQVLIIKGLQMDINNLVNKITKFIRDPKNYESKVELKYDISKNFLKELINLAVTKYQVQIVDGSNKLRIVGFKCKEAKSEIENLADQTSKLQFPAAWEDIITLFSQQSTIIKNLYSHQEEYLNIEKQFRSTMIQAKIIQIQRIQNRPLWKIYQTEKENMAERNGAKPLEKFLYHGTKSTNPDKIYNGSEGFDMRFSPGGMWGQAVYFAQNASYSNGYKYTVPMRPQSQMFFARVLIGNFKEMASDNSLKIPPFIEGSQTKRYDSVKGLTGGSDVYMIYTNKQAYPEYLITYQ